MEKMSAGEVEGCSSTEVLKEILYRYVGLRRRDLAVEVYELFVRICPVIFPVALADADRAKDLVKAVPAVGVRDAVHAAVMLNNDVTLIATFDRGFDEVPGVRRVELE
jgi:predicted nucleic acid-binding protein